MAQTQIDELAGAALRYNGDDWELTGTVEVLRNGEALHVEARKTERVRRNAASFQFTLQNPPASINPGNVGDLSGHIERDGEDIFLIVERPHTTGRYRLDSLNYS